jgi:hypothetical protein
LEAYSEPDVSGLIASVPGHRYSEWTTATANTVLSHSQHNTFSFVLPMGRFCFWYMILHHRFACLGERLTMAREALGSDPAVCPSSAALRVDGSVGDLVPGRRLCGRTELLGEATIAHVQ